jgi:predicted RNase H-like nuclease (RuvC/YqgF family)
MTRPTKERLADILEMFELHGYREHVAQLRAEIDALTAERDKLSGEVGVLGKTIDNLRAELEGIRENFCDPDDELSVLITEILGDA